MTDGSIKLGEIHFNKSNYREFNPPGLPNFIKINQTFLDETTYM